VNIAFGVEFFRPFFWLLKIPIRRILPFSSRPSHVLGWLFNYANIR
jgi:hypothetical protein